MAVGGAVVATSAAFMCYVSVVDEALHNYNLARMVELIGDDDPRRKARFEVLTRKDDDLIQAASIGRVIGFMIHYAAWVVLIGTEFGSFLLLDLAEAAVLSVVSAILLTVIAPPLLIRKRYEETLLRLMPGFRLAALPLRPVTMIGSVFRRMGARIEGAGPEAKPQESFHNDLADRLEEGAMEGVVDDEQREMIHNVVELGNTPAAKAMIPRTDMVCANLDEGLAAALRLSVERGHARVPVYQGSRDHIVGILMVRDLTGYIGRSDSLPELKAVMRPPRYWPESITLADLLEQMRRERLSIGVLVDEHGGTAGLITLEDILEEIVGDIRDEFDRDETKKRHTSIVAFSNDQAEADGDVDIDEINRRLELALPESPDYNSLAGFLIQRLGHMPAVGESHQEGRFKFTVLAGDERRIRRVGIMRLLPQPNEAS